MVLVANTFRAVLFNSRPSRQLLLLHTSSGSDPARLADIQILERTQFFFTRTSPCTAIVPQNLMDVIFHTKVHLPGTSYHDCTLDMLALSDHLRLPSKHTLSRVYSFSFKLFQVSPPPFLSSNNPIPWHGMCLCNLTPTNIMCVYATPPQLT